MAEAHFEVFDGEAGRSAFWGTTVDETCDDECNAGLTSWPADALLTVGALLLPRGTEAGARESVALRLEARLSVGCGEDELSAAVLATSGPVVTTTTSADAPIRTAVRMVAPMTPPTDACLLSRFLGAWKYQIRNASSF